jgi:hypothetical protein
MGEHYPPCFFSLLLFDNRNRFRRSVLQAAIGRVQDFLVLPTSFGTGNLLVTVECSISHIVHILTSSVGQAANGNDETSPQAGGKFPGNRENYKEFAISWPAKAALMASKLWVLLENPRQKVRIEQGNSRARSGKLHFLMALRNRECI